MRRRVLQVSLGVALMVAPTAVVAAVSLAPIMESWSHSKHDIVSMLAGRSPYDETQTRSDLQRYVTSSRLLAREVTGGTTQARDFRSRLETFANDSQSALDMARQQSTVADKFNRMLADCQFCHAIYNN